MIALVRLGVGYGTVRGAKNTSDFPLPTSHFGAGDFLHSVTNPYTLPTLTPLQPTPYCPP